MLSKEECQSIILRLSPIVDFGIHIINPLGVILASTDENMVDQYSEESVQTIKENKLLETQQGVYLPLINNELLIGVIAIIGDSKKVMNQGKIIRELVEHIVLENESQQFKVLHQEALRSFFIELFNTNMQTDYNPLINRAKLLEFDYDVSRVLVLCQIVDRNDIDTSHSFELVKKRVLNTIRHHIEVDDISLMLYEEYFVIIIKWRGNLEFYLKQMINAIKERLHVNVNMIVGGRCDRISDYGRRYYMARRVSDFSSNMTLPSGVHFANKYELELLLSSLSENTVNEYLELYEDIIESYQEDESKNELLETIKVYFECNMNIGETAQSLFVHRNTVGYRLNKFKDQYKVSINKPFDCMKIYIAIKMLEQNKPTHNNEGATTAKGSKL